MNWINIQTSTLRSPQFIGSDPIARGTWISVLGYCYEQENGGLIANCKGWKDRQWQQICGVTRNEIDGATWLMQWQDNDLIVWNYPHETEGEIKRKRESGRKGGQARTQAKIEAAKANGAKHNPSTTQAQPKQGPNGIEKKGKEKEAESGAGAPPPDLPLDGLFDEPEKPQKQPKQTDAEWLAELTTSSAYRGIDVRREHAKAIVWAAANKKTMSRRRFLNWINRCETAMAPQMTRAFVSTASVPEPNGWRAWINENAPESVYARGGTREGEQWNVLDRTTQDWLTKQTARAEQFQHRKQN
jgi:hypothetical protein